MHYMKNIKVRDISLYITLLFLALLLFIDIAFDWQAISSGSYSNGIELIERIFFGVGGIALMIHYFSAMYKMWQKGQYSWLLGSILFFFVSTILYCLTKQELK